MPFDRPVAKTLAASLYIINATACYVREGHLDTILLNFPRYCMRS